MVSCTQRFIIVGLLRHAGLHSELCYFRIAQACCAVLSEGLFQDFSCISANLRLLVYQENDHKKERNDVCKSTIRSRKIISTSEATSYSQVVSGADASTPAWQTNYRRECRDTSDWSCALY